MSNPGYSTATLRLSLSFNNFDGSPLVVEPAQYSPVNPAAQQSVGSIVSAQPMDASPITLFESMLAAGGNVSFGTAPVAPLREGMALAWTADTTRQLQAALSINGNSIPAAMPVSLPFAIPFDASASGSTQLFVYNNAWWGSAVVTITGYDLSGNFIGSTPVSIPVRQAGFFAGNSPQPVSLVERRELWW